MSLEMPLHLPLVLAAIVALFRDRADLVAENLALRQQLSSLAHIGKRPRLRPLDRFFWAMLSRYWSRWRQLLVIVQPSTVIAWHRKGFRLLWRWKSRKRRHPGRPRIAPEIRRLIAQMANNVGWGAPRIHGELCKLGIEISQATVSRYMPKPPPRPGSRQSWSTFLTNHRHELLAIDFAVVPTIGFDILYIFFVLSVDRRKILHFNVTKCPTAEWTAQQVIEACPFELPGRFLVRDNDSIYGATFVKRVDSLGLEQVKTAPRAPWQNCFAERWIGSLRRECLDHIIAMNERQLRGVIARYVDYFHEDRTHLGLAKDTPTGREVEGPELGAVVAFPRVGSLHHRYARERRRAA